MAQKDGELKVSWSRQGLWFLVKRITCLHTDLTRNYNLLVQNTDFVPDWLSQGITTLIPKNDKTDQAKNYWPITCQSVFLKTLISVSGRGLLGIWIRETSWLRSTRVVDKDLLVQRISC